VEKAMVAVRLNGYFPPDFVADERVMLRTGDPPLPATPAVEIVDARPLQAEAASEAAFFDTHGFVLLAHETAVIDWDPDPEAPDQSHVARVYGPEIETLVRTRLLPGANLQIRQGPAPLRRGRGTPNPFYAEGIHQDYGLGPDDYQESVEAFVSEEAALGWRAYYDSDAVAGLTSIDFWRTTGMDGPLKHMPLALCDPSSVDPADIVPSSFEGVTPTGKPNNQMSLRYNRAHRWYHYPDMVPGEVLAFRIFDCAKANPDPTLRTCFHTAFRLPGAPADAQERQSCEHRIAVFHLRG
jgi:hypothetical protein